VAAQQLGIDVPVNVVDLSNPEVATELARKSTGLQAGTQGFYMDIRGTGIRIFIDGSIE
jgi:hypothetical protein